MIVTVRGRRWDLLFERLAKTRQCDGLCDPPQKPGKKIRIEQSLSGERRLEIILHELMHAGHWDMSEEAVEEFAADAARILTKLGYKDRTDE